MSIKNIIKAFILLCPFNLFALETATPAFLGETLIYDGSYQGRYSFNQKISVANIVFSTKKQRVLLPNKQMGIDSTLKISTKHSSFAEAVYPLLFRYRSLYQLETQRLWLLEKYKKTGRKIRHAIFYADGQGTILRYRADRLRKKNPLLPHPIQQWLGNHKIFHLYSKNKKRMDLKALDQMALINYIRLKQLKLKACLKLPTTSGKIQINYTICGKGLKKIKVLGRFQITNKIQFSATEWDEGKIITSHQPINVWFSIDKYHQPVKFSLQDKTGLYQANLRAIHQ